NEKISRNSHVVLVLKGNFLRSYLVAFIKVIRSIGHIRSHCRERADQKCWYHNELFHWVILHLRLSWFREQYPTFYAVLLVQSCSPCRVLAEKCGPI